LVEHSAGSALGYRREYSLDVFYALAATRRAQKFPSAASFKICLSKARSAMVRFNLAFSFSSFLRRFA